MTNLLHIHYFLFSLFCFRIVQCTDLHGYSGNGTFSDPYVSVTIQGPLSRYVYDAVFLSKLNSPG